MTQNFTITSTLPLPTVAGAAATPSDKIPRLGFGVYRSPEKVCEASVSAALAAGYRHVDSAQYYRNEAQVGEAVVKSGIPREELFLTTKILSSAGSVEQSLQKCRDSVAKLDLRGDAGYVDLFLIHSPNAGAAVRRELWTALERLQAEGRARHIGVSNYGIGHIEEMRDFARVWPPAVNQLELHPWCQQREIAAYCKQHAIVLEAYCPLTRMQRTYEPVLETIAQRHACKTTQVLVRYALQKDWVPLPKSDTPARIAENADVYGAGMELTQDEMAKLDEQDLGAEGAIVQVADNDA